MTQVKVLTDGRTITVPPMTLHIPLGVWLKIQTYAHISPGNSEINGLGYIQVLQTGVLRVQDVFLIDQTVTGVSVDNAATDIAKTINELIAQGVDTELVRFQWHSHVNMAAYFSGTDTNNIANWLGDWLVSLVVNRQGQFQARFDMFRPIPAQNIPVKVVIDLPTDPALTAACQDDVRTHVKLPGTTGFLSRKPKRAEPNGLTEIVPLDLDNEAVALGVNVPGVQVEPSDQHA